MLLLKMVNPVRTASCVMQYDDCAQQFRAEHSCKTDIGACMLTAEGMGRDMSVRAEKRTWLEKTFKRKAIVTTAKMSAGTWVFFPLPRVSHKP